MFSSVANLQFQIVQMAHQPTGGTCGIRHQSNRGGSKPAPRNSKAIDSRTFKMGGAGKMGSREINEEKLDAALSEHTKQAFVAGGIP